MKSKKLIIVVLCILSIYLAIYLALTTSTINIHKDEINRLRQRVDNLETVINDHRSPVDTESVTSGLRLGRTSSRSMRNIRSF
jgi:hypothetical protein